MRLRSHPRPKTGAGPGMRSRRRYALTPQSIERLALLKQELGLSYTVHLPLWSVEPSTPLAPVRQGSTRAVIKVIQATRPLQPQVYVLHATGALASEFYRMRLPEAARALILRQFQNNARESIQAILAEIHLHDSPWLRPGQEICYGQDHRPLGAGDLDVPRLLDRLTEAHFDGPIIFELRVEQALASLQVIRAIRPAAIPNTQ